MAVDSNRASDFDCCRQKRMADCFVDGAWMQCAVFLRIELHKDAISKMAVRFGDCLADGVPWQYRKT